MTSDSKFKVGDMIMITRYFGDPRVRLGTIHRVTRSGICSCCVEVGQQIIYVPHSAAEPVAENKTPALRVHPLDIQDEEQCVGNFDAEAIIDYDLERDDPVSAEIHSLIRRIADKPHHAPQYIVEILEYMEDKARKRGQMEGPIGLFDLFDTRGFLLATDLFDYAIHPSTSEIALIESGHGNGACSILAGDVGVDDHSGIDDGVIRLNLRVVEVPELGCTFNYYDKARLSTGEVRIDRVGQDSRAKVAWLERMGAALR